MAGGTDVLVKMTHGRLKPKAIIALKEIDGLNEIRFDAEEGLTVGATARLAEVTSHPDILNHYPALAHAVSCMANVEVRNMGTLVGNLCNAAPSADSAPPLMVMAAEVSLASLNGTRRLPLADFFKGPGITAMQRGEVMQSIHVPLPSPKSGVSYKRISARCGVDIAAVCVGAMAQFNGKGCTQAKIVLALLRRYPCVRSKRKAFSRARSGLRTSSIRLEIRPRKKPSLFRM